MGLRFDVLQAADENVQVTSGVLGRTRGRREGLDGGDLVGVADYAGDVPGAAEEEGGQELGDLAVSAEEEDVVCHCERVIDI